jgi:hypothetical protein
MIKSLTIILPYFPTGIYHISTKFILGTMERVEEEGQIATAMTFSRLLSTTPPR